MTPMTTTVRASPTSVGQFQNSWARGAPHASGVSPTTAFVTSCPIIYTRSVRSRTPESAIHFRFQYMGLMLASTSLDRPWLQVLYTEREPCRVRLMGSHPPGSRKGCCLPPTSVKKNVGLSREEASACRPLCRRPRVESSNPKRGAKLPTAEG